MVLDKGMIAEFDTVDTLLNNRDSIFYGMAKSAGLVGGNNNNNNTGNATIDEAIDEAFELDDFDINGKKQTTYL